MAKFLVTASYTEAGVKGLRKDGGTQREHVVRLAIEGLGGKLDALYFTLGPDDVIVLADLPDAVAATALSLAVAASGGARCRTTPLLTAADMDKAVSKNTAYRAPGVD
jgi:uncharacterized protein with GYD domain